MKFNLNFIAQRRRISSASFALILSAYFTFIINITLAGKLFLILKETESVNIFFVLSIPVFFFCAFNLLFLPFCIKYIRKIFAILLILVSSLVSYASYYYGIIFDPDMIINIVETDAMEAMTYLNMDSVLWFLSLGALPSIYIYSRLEISDGSYKKFLLRAFFSALASIVAISIIAIFFYKDYASVGRNNSNLNRHIIPTYYIASSYKYLKNRYFSAPVEYKYIGMDAKIVDPDGGRRRDNLSGRFGQKNNLMVIVVGETARSQNYELGGYSVPTNAYTRDIKNMFYFQNTTSCATATAASVPCMFGAMGRENYLQKLADNQDNLLDILKRVGYGVTWLENNSSCKGVCKNISTIDVREQSKYKNNKKYYPESASSPVAMLDNALLDELELQIDVAKKAKKDQIIILHIMGSHGPTYYQRYPKEFARFGPTCNRSDIQNCKSQEIINTYDNTILYTDYILSRIVELLKENKSSFQGSMIYMSDHGESLGEKGIYLHGMPYFIAPDEQTHIPFMSWFSDDFMRSKNISSQCLAANAKGGHYSHDNLFHSVLGILDVSTKIYNKKLDVFSPCRAYSSDSK